MNTPKPGDEPAFPVVMDAQGNLTAEITGLTKRELFAGMALMGYASLPDERVCPKDRRHDVEGWLREIRQIDAEYCVGMADAMLAELERTK